MTPLRLASLGVVLALFAPALAQAQDEEPSEEVAAEDEVADLPEADGVPDPGVVDPSQLPPGVELPPGVTPEMAAAAAAAGGGPSGGPSSFEAATRLLRLDMELETVHINPLWFLGGGVLAVGGTVGLAYSGVLLGEPGGSGGPIAGMVIGGVLAAAGIVLLILGIVEKLDVDARRAQLEERRDAMGIPATGMFRIGLGSGGEVQIR